MQHRIEWNGERNIMVIDNGAHGRIEMTLDEFVQLAADIRADLLLDDDPLPQEPQRRRLR